MWVCLTFFFLLFINIASSSSGTTCATTCPCSRLWLVEGCPQCSYSSIRKNIWLFWFVLTVSISPSKKKKKLFRSILFILFLCGMNQGIFMWVCLTSFFFFFFLLILSNSSGTTCATTRPCGELWFWRSVPIWIHHHPSTHHNSPHGRVVTQVVAQTFSNIASKMFEVWIDETLSLSLYNNNNNNKDNIILNFF